MTAAVLLFAACRDGQPPIAPSSAPPWTAPALLGVDGGPLPSTPNGWRFTVQASAPMQVDVTCTLDDDATEVHRGHADADLDVTLDLYGLLADAAYTCVVATERGAAVVGIVTPPLPEVAPELLLTVPGDANGAYVLFDHHLDTYDERPSPLAYVVDRDGRIRWTHTVVDGISAVDTSYLGDGVFLLGGETVPPQRVDLAGAVLARADASPLGKYSHQATQIGTGETLALVSVPDTAAGLAWQGFAIEARDPALGAPTWTWRSQTAVDAGALPLPATPEDTDPYHANAFDVLLTPDGAAFSDVFVNIRSLNQLIRVDAATGDVRWHLGPGGDFALVDADEAPLPAEEWAWGSHGTKVALPDVWMYDNGRDRPVDGDPYSRIVAFEVDEATHTARLAWEHREDGWFEPIWGDVDPLPDGRVLFTRAHCDHCIGPADQRTEIVELDPATDTVTWRLTFGAAEDAGYRASRIDGCALFANEKYCPVTAERASDPDTR